MALVGRVFNHFNFMRNEEERINFIPSELNGKELYSVINSKNEFCGYITPSFLDSIIIDKDGTKGLREGFQVNSSTKEDDGIIIRNIILDKPSKECSDLEYSIVLNPIDSSKIDPTLEPLTIIANKKFNIASGKTTLDLKFNDNTVEADTFSINTRSCTTTTTLDIELAKNCARDIMIDGIRPRNKMYENQDIYFKLKCTNKSEPINIEIFDFFLEPEKDEQGNLVYPHFETGRNFFVNHGGVRIPAMFDLSLKTPFKIVSTNGDIVFKRDSTLRFKYSGAYGSSLIVKDDIIFYGVDVDIDGKNVINGAINVIMKNNQSYKSILGFKKTTSNSDITFVPLNKDKMKAFLIESNLDNGDNPILLKGEVWLEGVNLRNKRDKELLLRNVHVDFSNLINVSDLTEFSITNAEVENFNFNNQSKNKDTAFSCDINNLPLEDKTIQSSLKNVEVSLNEGETFVANTGPLRLSNVTVTGNTNITTEDNNFKSVANPVTMSNVILSNVYLFLFKDNDNPIKETIIDTSELSGIVKISDCNKIEGSLIRASKLDGFKEIKDSIIEEHHASAKNIDKIINYDSTNLGGVTKDYKTTMVTNKLEIL